MPALIGPLLGLLLLVVALAIINFVLWRGGRREKRPTNEATSGIESKVTVNASASGMSLMEYSEYIHFNSKVLRKNTLTSAKKAV